MQINKRKPYENWLIQPITITVTQFGEEPAEEREPNLNEKNMVGWNDDNSTKWFKDRGYKIGENGNRSLSMHFIIRKYNSNYTFQEIKDINKEVIKILSEKYPPKV